MAGSTSRAEDFAVGRYDTDGRLNTTFGPGGEVVTSFGPKPAAIAGDVVIGDDRDIFLAVILSGNNLSDFLLASFVGMKDRRLR